MLESPVVGAHGQELFDVVAEYADLGDHRTGTPVDEATLAWFARKLEALGASVTSEPFPFDRYVARWDLRVDGRRVEAVPLFYEGVGDVRTDSPELVVSRVVGGTEVPDFDRVAPGLVDRVAAAVLVTDVPGGHLCVPNREPRLGSGLPTLCVAGRDGDLLRTGRVELELSARIEPARSANVVASFGDGDDRGAVLLTTPLSGWFRCAGERGTGIAVCLEVARQLSASGPVRVLGTSGHELSGLGVRHHLAATGEPAAAIFHFGASVASGDADGRRPPERRSAMVRATAWAGHARRGDLEAALAPLGADLRLPTDDEAARPGTWLGEAAVWAPLGRPLVSIAGGFPLHHVPTDVPRLATTPELLEASLQASLRAADVLRNVARERWLTREDPFDG